MFGAGFFLQFTASSGGDGWTEGQTEVDEGGRMGRSMWREAARWNDLSAGQQITRKKYRLCRQQRWWAELRSRQHDTWFSTPWGAPP